MKTVPVVGDISYQASQVSTTQGRRVEELSWKSDVQLFTPGVEPGSQRWDSLVVTTVPV